MAATSTLTLRCPACGQDLRAVVGPFPPTQWFPCPHCQSPVPVVVPRDLPPLYSWEVIPGLYPALPRPRPYRWRARRATAVALVAVVLLAVVFGGILTDYALAAGGTGHYLVSGTVYEQLSSGRVSPALGARVALTEEGGSKVSFTTGAQGAFSFQNVPTGGITLNVFLSGYDAGAVSTFASPVYDAGTTGLSVTLVPMGSGNSTNETLSPFSGLEQFLASIDTGIVLLGAVAVVGAIAAMLTLREDRPAVGVVGGGAGIAAPFVLYLLALGTPFPLLVAATTLLAAFGGFALGLRAAEIGQTAPAPGPD